VTGAKILPFSLLPFALGSKHSLSRLQLKNSDHNLAKEKQNHALPRSRRPRLPSCGVNSQQMRTLPCSTASLQCLLSAAADGSYSLPHVPALGGHTQIRSTPTTGFDPDGRDARFGAGLVTRDPGARFQWQQPLPAPTTFDFSGGAHCRWRARSRRQRAAATPGGGNVGSAWIPLRP
jgi:hypothetical protein